MADTGRQRALSDPSAMATLALRTFLNRLQELRESLQAVEADLLNAAAEGHIENIEAALKSVQTAAVDTDPAGRLNSGQLTGLATQLRVLRQAAALQNRLQRCRLRVRDARAGRPCEPASGSSPYDDSDIYDDGEGSNHVASDNAALPPLPRSGQVDPMLSQLVTRALTGRFSAAASHAMASSLAAEAHQLLARLEQCPLRLLADVLAAHGYDTLHDLATVNSSDAGRILTDVLQQHDSPTVPPLFHMRDRVRRGERGGKLGTDDDPGPPREAHTRPGRSRSPVRAAVVKLETPAGGSTSASAAASVSASSASVSTPVSATATMHRSTFVTVESEATAMPPHASAWPPAPTVKPFKPFSLSSSGGAALMNAPLVSPIDRGLVIPEHDAVLGSGKFGAVYRCNAGRRPCALKMVKVGSTADAFQATMRVVEEAKHLMELRHPNILEYRDVFGHHAVDQNFVCILMELCDGGTLSDVVFDLGLDLGGIVDVCRQLTSALAYAHAQGVVHCDVKLENVLVRRCKGMRDLIKLGDWGLARRESSALLLEAPPSPSNDSNATDVLGANTATSSMELITATASRLPGSREGRGAEAGVLSFFSQDSSGALACGATSRTFAEEMVIRASSSGEAVPQPVGHPSSRMEDEKLALLEVAERAAARSATALSAPKGTMCYQPPEAFEEGRRLRRAGTRWAADMWALGCLLWEAATADCLPMGTGGAILGRQALLPEEEWQARLRERMQAFVKAVDALPAARGVPSNVAAEARRALVGLLGALWQPLPLARPVARDVATLALWYPDKLVLKLLSPALS